MLSTAFLYANCMKIHRFKTKDSEIKSYALCLKNILKDFVFDNMIKIRLNGKVYNHSVSYETIDFSDIKDIQKCLMKNTALQKCLDY